jgi:acyl-CoA synthetase (NDP forming)
VPDLDDVRLDDARDLVAARVADAPDGEWLDAAHSRELLDCFGIDATPTVHASTSAYAAQAAEQLGYPVAIKAASPTIVHKTEVGGVALGLTNKDDVGRAFEVMHERLGDSMGGALVQKMVPSGVETIVGVTRDASFGSLVLFGMGGIASELMRDTALRIVPITDVDAQELVRSLRSSPLLFGYRNTPAVDVAALERLILRVGLLAEHLPEVAELDCNPVVVSADGLHVIDVKLRLAPVPEGPPADVRRLRDPS